MEMKHWKQSWLESEQHEDRIDPNRICTFGIKPLDDALLGMLPNDLVVIGADSGVGKSEICLDLAIHNASSGKKVALYFIEGGEREAMYRIRWKMIVHRYFHHNHRGVEMDYRKWRMGRLKDPLIRQISQECMVEFEEKIKDNLHIFSFEQGFTIDNLMNSMGYFNKMDVAHGMMVHIGYDIDLIIIDHLQYFTLSDNVRENTEITQILMKVKDITQHHNVPVVLISHLRKKEKDRGLPAQEDFFGTSNICKVASVAITIAPAPGPGDYVDQLYPTFFRVVKSRTGIRPTYAMLCDFDLKSGQYADVYDMYNLIKDIPTKKPIERFKLPNWAYNSVKPQEVK